MQTKPFSGQGPGAQAKDGCSVELYRRLPYAGVEFLAQYLKPGMSVLELGCGTGRLTRRWLSFGCAVTAVDNSEEMLAHAPKAACLVCSDIEHLSLAKKFDVVILPSGLINHADAAVRSAFLAAAAGHMKFSGRFILQRQDPAWLESAAVGPAGESDGLAVRVESVKRVSGTIEMTLKYTEGGQTWMHSFTLSSVDESMLQLQLHATGFGSLTWLDAGRRWASASFQNAG
jgi:SAM-dependent methyltransferase